MKHRISRVNDVQVIQVIKVVSLTGGHGKDDPYRDLHEYYSMDGELLARVDRYKCYPEQEETYDDGQAHIDMDFVNYLIEQNRFLSKRFDEQNEEEAETP